MQPKRLNLVVSNKITQRIKDYQKLCELLGIICVFAFAPLIVIILIFLYVYRRLVEIVLKIQLKKKFAGLLKGTDSVWAAEDIVSLSIINVLMILENTQNTNVIFLEDLRNLINNRIVSKAVGTSLEKLLYRRNQKFGYYFWEKSEEIDLKNRIRWLECENANCDGSCEDIFSETFRRNLGNVCNRPLPDDNMAAWECLVGKRCTRSRSCVEEGRLLPEEHLNTDLSKIPVIFRVHHSLGDGVALLQVLLKAISEESEVKMAKIKFDDSISINKNEKDFREIISPSRNLGKILQGEMKVARFCDKDIFVASVPFIYIPLSQILKDLRSHFCALLKFSGNVTIDLLKRQMKMWIDYMWLNFKNLLKQLCKKVIKAMRLTMILFSAPRCLIQQTIRSMDENALHGSSQTGEKLVSYWLEDDVNKSQKLLMKIREIKNITGARFGDIILAAFSASVHKYHLCINKPAPDALTVIIPIRMTMPDENITLDNKFSLAYLQICISNVNGQTITEPHKDSQFFKRLQDITRAHNELRRGPNILLNSWVIKYLSAILPAKILKALLSSLSFSTMAFSNMCGPQKVRILNNTLSNMIFWIPNKDNTALGFSLLSYGDNLHLSLIADKSIIEDERLFMEILEDTVREIDIAYNSITHAFMNH